MAPADAEGRRSTESPRDPRLLASGRGLADGRARYMTLETIAPMSDDPIVGLPAVAA